MKRQLQCLIAVLLMMNIIFQNPIYFAFSFIVSILIAYHIDLTKIDMKMLYSYRRRKIWQLILSSILIVLLSIFYNLYPYGILVLACIIFFMTVVMWSHVRIMADGIAFRMNFYPWKTIEEKTITKNYDGEYEIKLSTFRTLYLDKKALDFMKS